MIAWAPIQYADARRSALPSLARWCTRTVAATLGYSGSSLVVIGVHAPEFSFEKNIDMNGPMDASRTAFTPATFTSSWIRQPREHQ